MVSLEQINFQSIIRRDKEDETNDGPVTIMEIKLSDISSSSDIWERILLAVGIFVENESTLLDTYIETYNEPLVLTIKDKPQSNSAELLTEIDNDITYLIANEKDIVCYLDTDVDLIDLYSEIKGLKEDFAIHITKNKEKDEIIDKLHRENTKYRNGLIEKINESMSLDIIQTIDDIKKTQSAFSEKEPTEENYGKLLKALGSTILDLQDILYRQNIETYSCDSEKVDVKRQKVVKTIQTDDPEKHNTIAERIAPGFESENKIIRPERISIYKYTERKD